MPSKKHTKKNKVVARGDANENVRKSIAERERVTVAMMKRREKLMQEYEEEMQRRKLVTETPTQTQEVTGTESA